MLESDELHRQAALLSNTLADFDAADVAGRKPVVERILELRELWKDARYELATGQKRREEKAAKPTMASQGLGVAEIKLEIQKTRVNISKYTTKLEDKPEHKLAATWSHELARLKAILEQYTDDLRIKSYEASKGQ